MVEGPYLTGNTSRKLLFGVRVEFALEGRVHLLQITEVGWRQFDPAAQARVFFEMFQKFIY